MAFITSAVVLGSLWASAASAQSNPFVPPQSGLSRAQIQELVRQEVERVKVSQPKPEIGPDGKPLPNANVQSKMNNLPTQPGGVPAANTAGGPQGQPAAVVDVVADLIKEGGIFVGCVDRTPVFKDKSGRRAYFTTKELRESNEARRFTRCG